MINSINNIKSYPIVVTIANDEYSLTLAVMLKSIETNLKYGTKPKIYILNKNLNQKAKEQISNSLTSEILELHWIDINEEKIHGLKVDGHISIDTYYRLLIEEYFPQYPKVIYLDADVIVATSICELWNLEFHNSHLLAVPITSKKSGFVNGERGIPSYKLLNIPSTTRTFNAGVMVLNLTLWRRDLISQSVIKYLREYKEHVLWWDQDGLNAILYNKWLPINTKWNAMAIHLISRQDSLLTKIEFEEVCSKPFIIHYAGPLKPWHSNYKGLFKDIFLEYVNKLCSNYFTKVYEALKIKNQDQ
jgi:lipopolysaccharide biosynthesis glycosyltransferase